MLQCRSLVAVLPLYVCLARAESVTASQLSSLDLPRSSSERRGIPASVAVLPLYLPCSSTVHHPCISAAVLTGLQVMLNQSDITADSQWTAVQPQLSRLAAFPAVRSQEERQQLFQEYVTDLQVTTQAI